MAWVIHVCDNIAIRVNRIAISVEIQLRLNLPVAVVKKPWLIVRPIPIIVLSFQKAIELREFTCL